MRLNKNTYIILSFLATAVFSGCGTTGDQVPTFSTVPTIQECEQRLPEFQDDCFDSYYLNNAISSNNPYLCLKISGNIQPCLQETLGTYDNPKACDFYKNEQIRSYCKDTAASNSALSKLEKEECSLLSSEELRQSCTTYIDHINTLIQETTPAPVIPASSTIETVAKTKNSALCGIFPTYQEQLGCILYFKENSTPPNSFIKERYCNSSTIQNDREVEIINFNTKSPETVSLKTYCDQISS